ncbi:unnamed protein product [Lathyrus oleraceus]
MFLTDILRFQRKNTLLKKHSLHNFSLSNNFIIAPFSFSLLFRYNLTQRNNNDSSVAVLYGILELLK